MVLPRSPRPDDPLALFSDPAWAAAWASEKAKERDWTPELREFRVRALDPNAPEETPMPPIHKFDAYQAFTLSTAKYIGVGKSSPEGIAYVGFGLGGEAGELCDKIVSCPALFRNIPVRDELGDHGYYFVRLVAECGWTLTDIMVDVIAKDVAFTGAEENSEVVAFRALALIGKVGRVQERMKKKMRGDNAGIAALTTLVGWEVFKHDLRDVAEAFANLAHILGWSVEEVFAANEAKLTSRLARGVILGEGDKR